MISATSTETRGMRLKWVTRDFEEIGRRTLQCFRFDYESIHITTNIAHSPKGNTFQFFNLSPLRINTNWIVLEYANLCYKPNIFVKKEEKGISFKNKKKNVQKEEIRSTWS